ncbi:hypothetical protein SAMN03097708_03047 [Thiohalomonas denitrificans]|uniref:Uncharacterized protein n=2 Tax=Thiohalomonas denitrificans TaxID=415747 RepID=A0A1G5QYL3_9GAMM|nr:hypothetical protein SAMN03097708_03047 [Thiohalomonas denitrificans]
MTMTRREELQQLMRENLEKTRAAIGKPVKSQIIVRSRAKVVVTMPGFKRKSRAKLETA